jgi:hypothetical protein
MTTIAFRNGVLAADTQMSYGDTPNTVPGLKLFIAGEFAVGVCGDCRYIPTIREWFEHGCPEGAERLWDDSFDILAMDVNGDLFTLFGTTLFPLPQQFFATGSGRLIALGAMCRGASAKEAVKCAGQFDTGTNEQVETITKADIRKHLTIEIDRQANEARKEVLGD